MLQNVTLRFAGLKLFFKFADSSTKGFSSCFKQPTYEKYRLLTYFFICIKFGSCSSALLPETTATNFCYSRARRKLQKPPPA